MLGKYLTTQLEHFNNRQWKRLLQWLQSPVHNPDKGLFSLGEYLSKQAPNYDKSNMHQEKLWEVIYPNTKLKPGVLRVKLHQLTQQVENFLAWQQLDANTSLKRRLHLEALVDSTPFDFFQRLYFKRMTELEQTQLNDFNLFHHKAAFTNLLISQPGFDSYRESGTYLKALSDSIDAFFILFKLRIGTQMQNRTRILGEEYQIPFWDIVQSAQQVPALKDNPISRLYRLLLKLLEAPEDEVRFTTLKTVFLETRSELPSEDLSCIYYSTLNYLSRMINQGGSQYYGEMLEWYKLGLEEKVLLSEGKMSEVTFNNIALLGYENGAFKWTAWFIKKYQSFLNTKLREDAVRACQGLGFFYQKQFLQAIDVLKGHRFSAAYQLRIRLLFTRCYYELLEQGTDVYDQLDKTIAAFESYLRRNKTYSDPVTEPYQNHLRYLRELMNLLGANRKSRQQVAHRILQNLSSESPVVAKQWLEQKCQIFIQ